MSACSQCGTVTHEISGRTIYGDLCPQCAYRQEERDEYGYGLSASTYGFLSDTE